MSNPFKDLAPDEIQDEIEEMSFEEFVEEFSDWNNSSPDDPE